MWRSLGAQTALDPGSDVPQEAIQHAYAELQRIDRDALVNTMEEPTEVEVGRQEKR